MAHVRSGNQAKVGGEEEGQVFEQLFFFYSEYSASAVR